MELILQRLHFTSKSTLGELFIDGAEEKFCHTLELPIKDGLPGSAIPPGTFKIELAPSPKFLAAGQHDLWIAKYASKMPHVIGIPKRSLIMLHWMNWPTDTDGCIGVGFVYDRDYIGQSRSAFAALMRLIEKPAEAGECTLEVVGGTPTPKQPGELNMQGDT